MAIELGKYRSRKFANAQELVEWLNSGKIKEENIVSIAPFCIEGMAEPSYIVIYKSETPLSFLVEEKRNL